MIWVYVIFHIRFSIPVEAGDRLHDCSCYEVVDLMGLLALKKDQRGLTKGKQLGKLSIRDNWNWRYLLDRRSDGREQKLINDTA